MTGRRSRLWGWAAGAALVLPLAAGAQSASSATPTPQKEKPACLIWTNDDVEAGFKAVPCPRLSSRPAAPAVREPVASPAPSIHPAPRAVPRQEGMDARVVNASFTPAPVRAAVPAAAAAEAVAEPEPGAASPVAASGDNLPASEEKGKETEAPGAPEASKQSDAVTAPALDDPKPDEIKPVRTRWRTYDLEGHPEISYRIYDPYHQNIIKADYPLAGEWFMELNALNTIVYKSRRNLDFSRVFADQIAAGTLRFFGHNSFYAENILFGAEFRRHEDAFVPSTFRFRVNGVVDLKHDINALNDGTADNGHLFDAFADIRLADFGQHNFDLLFLRGGFQGFRSDFHGLIFNDVGLGGRLFGEAKKNRLRYDFAYFKLYLKNGVSGFIDLAQPSRHQVAITRITWEDFLFKGWNSEWTFHYNRDHRPLAGGLRTDVDTFYLGAAFNGHLGRWIFNPAFYTVTGHADHLVGGLPQRHSVAGYLGVLDLQYPLDFWTFRLGYAYASGDRRPGDLRDTAFDAISDGVVLFGGPLSYWVGENIKFGAGDFIRANSLFPSFRGVNAPANYVNPGVQLINTGADITFSPSVQLAMNLNYLRFADTGAYVNRIVITDHNAGIEVNVFVRWKPFLHQINENVVLDTGFSILHPFAGLQNAFQSGITVYSTFTALRLIF